MIYSQIKFKNSITLFDLVLLLWYRGDMHLVWNNGYISRIGEKGALSKQEITAVPFKVESVIPYLQ